MSIPAFSANQPPVPFRRAARPWVSTALLAALLLGASQSGCVRRRMTIRSNPPGALVYVDDYEIGTTPISHNFTYYGQRKIRLVKDGYETLSVMQTIPPPWYQIPPLDFFAENLVPGEIRDRRTFSYQLTPQRIVPADELLERAENLRRGAQPAGGLAPLTPGLPGGVLPQWPTPAPLPRGPEPIPVPQGIGGQSIHPLPPSGPAGGGW